MDPASHLDDYLLSHILAADPACVPDALLVELRALGRRFRAAADAVLLSRFLSRWGLAGVGTPPPSPTAYLASQRHFTAAAAVAARGDTLSALALRHGTDPGTLRRLNNIISDHTLASRTEIFVPVGAAEALAGCVVDFRCLAAAHGRPMWVVRPLGEGEDLDALTTVKERAPGGAAAPGAPSARLQELMRRALGCDAPTARFYLTAAGGDLRRAMAAYHEDQRWERGMKGLKKALRKAARRPGLR